MIKSCLQVVKFVVQLNDCSECVVFSRISVEFLCTPCRPYWIDHHGMATIKFLDCTSTDLLRVIRIALAIISFEGCYCT